MYAKQIIWKVLTYSTHIKYRVIKYVIQKLVKLSDKYSIFINIIEDYCGLGSKVYLMFT